MHTLLVAPLAVCALLGQTTTQRAIRPTRAHDIRFLTRTIPQLPAPEWPTAGEMLLGAWSGPEPEGAPISFTASLDGDDSPVAPPGVGLSPEAVVDLVRKNVAEDSWANDLNSIAAQHGELVVVQTPDVQEAVARLLDALRARRGLLMTVDVACVPTAALGEAATSPAPWLAGGAFEDILGRAGERGARLTLTAYNEQRVHGGTGEILTVVEDIPVDQTGWLPVPVPSVRAIDMGLTVEAMPLAVAGTSLVRLELRLARLDRAGEAERRESPFGTIELQPLREESLETQLILPLGATGLAGIFRGSAPPAPDVAVIVRVRSTAVRDEAPAGVAEEAFTHRLYDVGLLVEPLSDEEYCLLPEHLEALVRGNVDPDAWQDARAGLQMGAHSRFLTATARPATHAQLRSYLDALFRARAVAVVTEHRSIEGPLDELLALRAAAEGGLLLPAGWQPGGRLRESLQATTVSVLGARARARALATRAFVADVPIVSGATSFTGFSVPDPWVERAGDGFHLSVATRPRSRTEHVLLDARWDVTRLELDRSAAMTLMTDLGPPSGPPLPVHVPAKTGDSGTDPAVTGFGLLPTTVSLPLRIDLPGQTLWTSAVRTVIPVRRAAIVKLEALADGLGRMVIVSCSTRAALAEGR